MADAFVIESAGKTVGIVVCERRGVRFYASAPEGSAFDGRFFGSVDAARRAISKLQRDRPAGVSSETMHPAA